MDVSKLILGAIGGDIIGSTHEFNPIKTKDFELLTNESHITDDSVMTIANMMWLSSEQPITIKQAMQDAYKEAKGEGMGENYGYGPLFYSWLLGHVPDYYGSFGNGSGMRVSPVAWAAAKNHSYKELSESTIVSAAITHNHQEGIRGAVAISYAIYYALIGFDKDEILKKVIDKTHYIINYKLDDIRENYKFNATCQGSVPQSLLCFMEAESYEETVRNAVSLGGDADTMAAMAGSIAEAYFGIPTEIKEKIWSYIPERLKKYVIAFSEKFSL